VPVNTVALVILPEAGQSMATAQQRIIEQAARDLISQMQSPW